MLFYVSFSYFMDVISSLFPLRILIIVWGVLLVNSYFLSSSLFQSCFFWSWMFTLDVFFQCLAYLLWLNCQLTALRWGLWIRSFPQGDVVRQYPREMLVSLSFPSSWLDSPDMTLLISCLEKYMPCYLYSENCSKESKGC